MIIGNDIENTLRRACNLGEKNALSAGFESLPVDPFKIAEDAGIIVEAKPSNVPGVSGMLLKNGNNFGILYATNIKNEGFQRFSVSHELGHYFLEGHADAILKDNVHHSKANFISKDQYEMEADQFATGLLMPRKLIVPALKRLGEGLCAIQSLATLCNVSLTSAAIRYVQCTNDPMAIIISKGQKIEYCIKSRILKDYNGLDWINKGDIIPVNTSTYEFNHNIENVQMCKSFYEKSSFQSWFGGSRNIEIREEIMGLGIYERTLTVLHDIALADFDEDEVSEENLHESWTPRFR